MLALVPMGLNGSPVPARMTCVIPGFDEVSGYDPKKIGASWIKKWSGRCGNATTGSVRVRDLSRLTLLYNS